MRFAGHKPVTRKEELYVNYQIKFISLSITADQMRIVAEGTYPFISELSTPKVILYFSDGIEDRRIPLVIKNSTQHVDDGIVTVEYNYLYYLSQLFWNSRSSENDITMHLHLQYGDFYEENIPVDLTPEYIEQDELCYICTAEKNFLRFHKQPGFLDTVARLEKSKKKSGVKPVLNKIYHWISFVFALCLLPWFILDAVMATLGIIGYANRTKKSRTKSQKFIAHINARLMYFSQHMISVRNAKKFVDKIIQNRKHAGIISAYNKIRATQPVRKNRISFISLRRTELSGNFQFVYDKIKDDAALDIQMYLSPKPLLKMSKQEIRRFAELCATSKVVVLDEFTPYIHYFDIRPETKIVQLWHACGAFKTFGFTRLGKPKGSPQKTRNHRNYDYVTVSTANVKKCHSEGFGIPTDHVVPTGIPRTDVFFDENYKTRTRSRLLEQYPQLQGKKVVLFAPTFRGHVKETAYYPVRRFDVGKFMDAVGSDYFLIIKHHPFVPQHHPIPEGYEDRVLDLSAETELNDLLFITDLIITDYSSLVFEASLLNIPMAFYTFDLKSYISQRDFYFDFKTFVPGNFFYTQEDMQEAILKGDLAQEKVEAFSRRFFDDFDGHSTERVVKLLYKALEE